VVVDALGGRPDPALRDRLGPELHDQLRHLLREHALAWARSAAGGAMPREAQGVEDVPALLRDWSGPVALVAPDIPGLGAHQLAGARSDLADGVQVVSATSSDGTPYLAVLARADPELLGLVGRPFAELLGRAQEHDVSIGMLRNERRLSSLGDARAVLADPLAPRELRELLAVLA